MSIQIDPRVSRSKELFEKALLDLLEEKEFSKISVREIASRSKLNRATFYLHYYDKEDLLQKYLDAAIDSLRANIHLAEVEFNYSSKKPHPVFIRMFEEMVKNKRFYQIMLAEKKITYFSTRVIQIIEEFIRQGVEYLEKDKIERRVPTDITISYISSAYLGVIIWWLKNDLIYSPEYMATQLTLLSTVGPFAKNPFV